MNQYRIKSNQELVNHDKCRLLTYLRFLLRLYDKKKDVFDLEGIKKTVNESVKHIYCLFLSQ